MTLEELKKLFLSSKSTQEDAQFYAWAVEKREIHSKEKSARPKRRQVWWTTIGKNIGHEQSCSEGFERPVLVLKVFGSIFWGLPITSSDDQKKKEKNPLYFKLEETEYKNEAGETKTLRGFVALHQLRVYDSRRLKRKILKMELGLFDEILSKIRGLLL